MTSSQSFSGGCPESGPLGVSGSRSATIDPLTGNRSVSGESYINTGGNAQSPVRRSGAQEISSYDDPPNENGDNIFLHKRNHAACKSLKKVVI